MLSARTFPLATLAPRSVRLVFAPRGGAGECRAPIGDRARREIEARSVPRASDGIVLELAVGERPSQVRAALDERANPSALPHEHDWSVLVASSHQPTFSELGVGQNRGEVLRELEGTHAGAGTTPWLRAWRWARHRRDRPGQLGAIVGCRQHAESIGHYVRQGLGAHAPAPIAIRPSGLIHTALAPDAEHVL